MELVYVPAGTFMMGSNNGEADEQPLHKVTIKEGFYMGRYEVTQAEWQKVMGTNPSGFKGDRLPVNLISWDDAQSFISKLSQRQDGFKYRLPTEAEWEYACRAGTTGAYAGDLDKMAWYANNSGKQTHPVGTKQPNAFGLYDMHGNAWEWCQDAYHKNYEGAPADGSPWLSGGVQGHRVLRGGSGDFGASILRSATRAGIASGFRYNNFGFRVVAIKLNY
jgi:formylglycine-generating enzyme required for sulfatase activity